MSVALAMGVVSACGSTVQVAGEQGLSGLGQGDGLGVGPDGTAIDALGAAPNGVSAGSGPGSTDASGSGTGSGTDPGVSGQQASGRGAAGSSNAPIRVGVLYAKGLDGAASAMGINGLTTGDTKAQAKAVFDWVNAHGGLGGRPVQVFSYGIDAAQSGNSPDGAYEAACTALTQDYKVRYVVTILNLRPNTLPCFSRRGVGVLDDQSGVSDATMAKYAAYLAGPGDFAPGRMIRILVDDLWKRGWLTPKSKVGSFAADTPDGAAVVEGPLTQALRAHGLRIVSDQRVSMDGNFAAQSSSAVLKFRSEGVDRIIPVLANPLFVMHTASSQSYHPAYAMYSSFGPGALMEGNAPKDQLKNSAGIGWQPFLDIGAGKHPGPVSSRETLCFALMKAAGQSSTSATTKGFQLQVCNVIFYLKAAADALRSVPNDLLTASRPVIGSSFRPADTFRTDVTHRPDGAAGYRALAYQTNCSCYQYVSPVRRTP